MRNRFDQLGKRIGRSALMTSGPTVAHDEITPDAQHADLRHEPDPARAGVRAQLGLLGRLASAPCLIELYGHAPSAAEFRACLSKHLAFWQRRARERGPRQDIAPFLWLIAAGTPASLLRQLAPAPARGWPRGVYFFGGDALRVGLVAAAQLRRDRSTLLVRLMAAGPLLSNAIEDLTTLPARAPERDVAEQILLDLRQALGKKSARTPEEEEFVVIMHKTWDDARAEGRDEGRLEEAAHAVLTTLRARRIRVPAKARERILRETNRPRLRRWLAKAAVAETLAEVVGDLS